MSIEASDRKSTQHATIGPSVCVKGEISGDEDILIEGSVEGAINLKKNAVTVAKSGRVKANISGVVIHVEGEVVGDLHGVEKVVVHSSGKVVGNISAPRISLEEGGKVKGMIDTESAGESTGTFRLNNKIEETRPSSIPTANGPVPQPITKTSGTISVS
ncbi:MAG: polymer-forming cytoskeletal protein [Bdellovibrionota bacterium]|nr:MAG: polymer-forming cytoskeletal protein [Bdellovibrionota bacterium]